MLGVGSSPSRWAVAYVVATIATAAFFFASALVPSLLAFILAALFAALALLTCPFVVIWLLAKKHYRHALAALAGAGLIISSRWMLPAANRALEDYSFRSHKAEYDKAVAVERKKEGSGQPVRMIVGSEDKSVFATSNLFVTLVYDETDATGADPMSLSGYLPCVGSPTGVADAGPLSGGTRWVESLGEHYFRVMDAN